LSATNEAGLRIPVGGVIKASFASVFRHLDNFVGRAWPWVAITAALTAFLGLGLGMKFEEQSAATAIVAIAIAAGATMIVVSWHRGLLLGEPGGPATAFRLDRPFWRYIGICILLALAFGLGIGLVAAVFMVPFALLSSDNAAIAGIAVVSTAAVLASVPLAARTMVALPMAAIDATPPLIRASWRLTRGNTWRLVGALLIVYVAAAVLQYGISLAAGLALALLGAGEHAYLVIQPLVAALGLLLAALFASLASYVYAILTNHPLGREVTG